MQVDSSSSEKSVQTGVSIYSHIQDGRLGTNYRQVFRLAIAQSRKLNTGISILCSRLFSVLLDWQKMFYRFSGGCSVRNNRNIPVYVPGEAGMSKETASGPEDVFHIIVCKRVQDGRQKAATETDHGQITHY